MVVVVVVCVSGLFCLMGVMRLFPRKGRKTKTGVSTKHVLKAGDHSFEDWDHASGWPPESTFVYPVQPI